MKFKRRKFEKEVLERLDSLKEALDSLSDDLALLQRANQPADYFYMGYTCGGCGHWVSFDGKPHICNAQPVPIGPNVCHGPQGSTARPNLHVVS